jgi:hypothetical protein
MSLQTRLNKIILLLEEVEEDCQYSDEHKSLTKIIKELREITLYSDTIH